MKTVLWRGVQLDARFADWQKDLFLFGICKEGEQKLRLFKLVCGHLWPEPILIWDEWCELFFGALCGAKETVERLAGVKIDTKEEWWRRVWATGAGATGKSAKAGIWILVVWLCAQQCTTAVLTSTSMDQLKRRIWHALLKWINASVEKLPLEPLPGDCEIRWAAGDKLSCIFGIPVKSGGDESEAIDRIKGLHNTVTLLVIDEATAMPDAITEAERNLRKGTIKHQVIGLGNATDPNDLHGRNMEPEGGWNSITVDSIFWLNKLGGCSLHFDGYKSPRLKDDAKYHYYIGEEDIRIELKYNGGEGNPRFWSEVRGFWPPTGLSTTIMDSALLTQFEVEKPAVWKGGFQVAASFDPAFEGGDRRVLQPFRWGEFANGIHGIEFLDPIIVSIAAGGDVRWIHYEIADAVQAQCEGYQIGGKPHPILPQNFIMDTTGEGGGLFSVLSGRWSQQIQSIEFGGAADKVQIAPDRPTTYYELYANKVTMLWYVFRRFVEGSQIKGLTDAETKLELTSRDKKNKNGKTQAVPKSEMKLAKNRSPDKADAAVIAAEFLRRKGVTPAGTTGGAVASMEAWNAFAERANANDDTADYTDDNAAFA